MALDATIGGAASDTYGTLAEADAYFASRQSGNWDGSDAHKEMALRKAATYLDQRYLGSWRGSRVFSAQLRAWPRVDVIDVDGFPILSTIIPVALKNAQFEAAAIIASGVDLEAAVNRAVKREKVGPIEVEYTDSAGTVTQYPSVSNWLRGLVMSISTPGSGFSQSRMLRA